MFKLCNKTWLIKKTLTGLFTFFRYYLMSNKVNDYIYVLLICELFGSWVHYCTRCWHRGHITWSSHRKVIWCDQILGTRCGRALVFFTHPGFSSCWPDQRLPKIQRSNLTQINPCLPLRLRSIYSNLFSLFSHAGTGVCNLQYPKSPLGQNLSDPERAAKSCFTL